MRDVKSLSLFYFLVLLYHSSLHVSFNLFCLSTFSISLFSQCFSFSLNPFYVLLFNVSFLRQYLCSYFFQHRYPSMFLCTCYFVYLSFNILVLQYVCPILCFFLSLNDFLSVFPLPIFYVSVSRYLLT